jgi:hypothetical protein
MTSGAHCDWQTSPHSAWVMSAFFYGQLISFSEGFALDLKIERKF